MLTAAQEHYRHQQQLSRQAAARAARLWALGLDPQSLDDSATALTDGLLRIVIAGQLTAATAADPYADTVLAEQGLRTDRTGSVLPAAFAGTASDGRSLATLVLEPLIRVKTALGGGQSLADALAQGLSSLSRIVSTQVTDAGRVATGTALVARPAVDGYVRHLSLPSCSRCAILAGRFYRWSSGFQRHPHCDCQNIPTTEHLASDLTTDATLAYQSGQVTGLSASDTKAIEDGADIAQVVNAHRGMSTADAFGRQLKITNEGVTVRGRAGQALTDTGGSYTKTPRLRPESIYAVAKDRDDAQRLLRRFGYLK